MGTFASGPAIPGTPYHDGKVLVVPAGASLPPMCVKCGEPVPGQFLTKNFRWHPPWIYLLILIGILIYVIVALVMQKSARISVPFCAAHRSWRANMNIIAAVLLLGWIPESLFLSYLDVSAGWIVLISIAMPVAGLILLVVVSSSFAPVYIDHACAKFKGAGERFLATLPSGLV
jgi:hypothetical protein